MARAARADSDSSRADFTGSVRRGHGRVSALDGVALGHPARQPFVEHAMVTPAELVQDVAGPPGQCVRACSVEDDQAGPGDLVGAGGYAPQRHGPGALDVLLDEVLPVTDIDDVGARPAVEEGLELVDGDEVDGILG